MVLPSSTAPGSEHTVYYCFTAESDWGDMKGRLELGREIRQEERKLEGECKGQDEKSETGIPAGTEKIQEVEDNVRQLAKITNRLEMQLEEFSKAMEQSSKQDWFTVVDSAWVSIRGAPASFEALVKDPIHH